MTTASDTTQRRRDGFTISTDKRRLDLDVIHGFLRVAYPDLQGLRRFLPATADAHGLYAQSGFAPLARPERWMEISPGAAVYEQTPATAGPG